MGMPNILIMQNVPFCSSVNIRITDCWFTSQADNNLEACAVLAQNILHSILFDGIGISTVTFIPLSTFIFSYLVNHETQKTLADI